jgi:hypothetical protein
MTTNRPGRLSLSFTLAALGLSAAAPLSGCSSASIALKESIGIAKREQLVARVQDARDAQGEAKKQFESALAEFLAVTGTGQDAKVAELEARYKKLKSEQERSQSRAEAVRGRIKDTERVADALFSEWNTELKQYQSEAMREASRRQLEDTRGQYQKLLGVMKQAEARMAPVLAALSDQVLFLKHNLNARAIAALQPQAAAIQTDVAALVREMEASINEANAFISQMKTE